MEKPFIKNLLFKLLFSKEGFGFNPDDPNLKNTPDRLMRMYCNEFFRNVDQDPKEIASFPNEGYDEIIMLDNITFTSICSHHFLPFQGHAWLLYIPDASLVGASKPVRIIDFFSRKPQLQERLCMDVINHFVQGVKPKGAMLVMRAGHGCMTCRGVNVESISGMTTSAIYGAFKEQTVRNEGLDLIKISIMDRRG